MFLQPAPEGIGITPEMENYLYWNGCVVKLSTAMEAYFGNRPMIPDWNDVKIEHAWNHIVFVGEGVNPLDHIGLLKTVSSYYDPSVVPQSIQSISMPSPVGMIGLRQMLSLKKLTFFTNLLCCHIFESMPETPTIRIMAKQSAVSSTAGVLYNIITIPHYHRYPSYISKLKDGRTLALTEAAKFLCKTEQAALPSMKLMYWNCRGADKPEFRTAFFRVIEIQRPSVCVITDTRVSGELAKIICGTLGFGDSIRVDGDGSSGGIWLLWDPKVVAVDLLTHSAEAIIAKLKVPGDNA